MVFKSLITIASALTLATALSFGSACGIHPADEQECYPRGYCGNTNSVPKPPVAEENYPEILSTPETEAQVDVPYIYEIETIPITHLWLLKSPIGMKLINNTIHYTPIHSGAKDVRIIAKNRTGYDRQDFTINVGPGEFFRYLKDHWKYDHIQYDNLENPGIVFLCEEKCPEVYSEDYLNKKMIATKSALSTLWEIIQQDVPEENKPIDIHLNNDSVCQLPLWLAGSALPTTIYIPKYDRVLAGLDFTCLDNSVDKDGNLKYPEVCKPGSTYVAPDSLSGTGGIVHEYAHILTKADYIFNESLAKALSYVVSGDPINNPNGLDSFRKLPYGDLYYTYMRDLCQQYGFDLYVLPEFYDKMISFSKNHGGRNLTQAETKCIVDYLVSKKKGHEINTHKYFCEFPQTCDSSVKDYPCGDEI